jgi:poly-gamma-glutamate biosynthesis protein PgsC/CapC
MNLTESIAIGLVLGFFFYEWVGFSAGGFVVPGYLALYWDRPLTIAATLGISLVTYGVMYGLSRVTILYGRRRFILTVLTGFVLQWFYTWVGVRTFVAHMEVDTIGYIIPGLIANEMARQRILPTLGSLMIVSVAVRLILIVAGYFQSG